MKANDNGWLISLEGIKQGDVVGIESGRSYANAQKLTVTRRTPTQIVLSDGSRWNENCREVGGGYTRRTLVTPTTADTINAQRAARHAHGRLVSDARDALKELEWFNDSQLARIIAIAKEQRS